MFSGFFRIVKQALEAKYIHLNGLRSLRVKEMKIPTGTVEANKRSEGQYKNSLKYKNLPDDDETLCHTLLTSNMHVLCNLESQDLWLSVILHMHSPDFKNFSSSFEIKVGVNIVGKDLKLLI